MIGHEERIVAARYASALLAIYQKPFSEIQCAALKAAIDYYHTTPMVLIYLQTPFFSDEQKKEALVLIRNRYNFPGIVEKLDLLLLEHARIFLLPIVYAELIRQSQMLAGRIPCTVTSAVSLSGAQQQMCTQFVASVSHKTPLIEWAVDPALIAGIRFQTENWLWEDSLDARLRALATTLLT